MPNVTMPNGDIVAFPDDMPKETIRGLIAKKFPDSMPSGHAPVQAQNTEDKNNPLGGDLGMNVEHGDNGILSQMGRQAGLATRYIAEGVPSMAYMVGDAANALVDKGLESVGSKYRLGPVSKAISQKLTEIGLPEPKTPGERVVGDMSRAVAGLSSTKALGDFLQMGGSQVQKEVGKILAQNMGNQAASAMSATGAAGTARENGVGPVGQTAIGVLAGTLGPAAVTSGVEAGKRVYGLGKEMFRPTDQIVGTTLKKLAQDPEAAINNLRNAQEIIPNSPYTTGEASADYGLMAAQRAIKNKNPVDFADISSRQNTARNQFLDELAGSEQGLSAAKNNRDSVTSPMRDSAFSQSKQVLPGEPLDKIDEIMQSPLKHRDAVNNAMQWARDKILGVKDPASLYEIRKDINDAIAGKFDSEKPALRLASGQLKQVRDALDQAIERGANGFGDYLSKYSEMSKPINQMEVLQDVRNRITNAAPDTTGYSYLSQPKLANILKGEDFSKTLTEDQTNKLFQLMQDMDRSATLNNPSIRPMGSDTVANASGNEMLKQALTAKLNALPGGKYVAAMRQSKLDDRLKEAFTTPDLAALLMGGAKQQAAPQNLENFRRALLSELIGANLATATQQR